MKVLIINSNYGAVNREHPLLGGKFPRAEQILLTAANFEPVPA